MQQPSATGAGAVPPAVNGLIGLGTPPGRDRPNRAPERRVVLAGMLGAAAFLAAAGVGWLTGLGAEGRWAPLHLALAGGASLAIGTLLPHFVVSLAVSRPAPARWRLTSLGLLAAGALLAVSAVSAGWVQLGAVGAALFVAGIVGTALTAFLPARAGLGRRGGVVELAYALALCEVAISVSAATLYLAGVPAVVDRWAWLKPAHAWLNLVGFAGLVIAATLIHLYPTVVGSRINPRRSLLVLVCGMAGGAALVAIGYALASDLTARAGALVTVAGAAAALLVGIDGRRARGRWTTDLDWHRLTIGHLSGAIAWLAAGLVIAAAAVLVNGADPAGWSVDRLVGPLVVGCVLQVLVGAWSHLAPAVGPGDLRRHALQRRVLGRWPWPRLALLNGGALLVSAGTLAGSGPAVAAGGAMTAVAMAVALGLLGIAVLRR